MELCGKYKIHPQLKRQVQKRKNANYLIIFYVTHRRLRKADQKLLTCSKFVRKKENKKFILNIKMEFLNVR